jgi:hypothetical protein
VRQVNCLGAFKERGERRHWLSLQAKLASYP